MIAVLPGCWRSLPSLRSQTHIGSSRTGAARIPLGAEERDRCWNLTPEPARPDWQLRLVRHVVGGEPMNHPDEKIARLRCRHVEHNLACGDGVSEHLLES
jgi:hypothetical protein